MKHNVLNAGKTTVGNVIFLNGPSSAGKTTLSELLQQKLPDPFMNIGMDKIIFMMPLQVNNWTGLGEAHGFWWLPDIDEQGKTIYHLQFGPYAKKAMETLKDMVIALVQNGHNVIVDEVCFGVEGVASWRRKLANLCAIFVGVKAPLQILELRERIRGDRIVGSARAQFYTVHKDVSYDMEVDTHSTDIEECAQMIIDALYDKIKSAR